ncbi:hypothetical protein V8E51_008028 [Hyaloscypha variabilis]
MGCSPNVNFGRERIAGCGCEYFIVGGGGRPRSERRGSRGGKRRGCQIRADRHAKQNRKDQNRYSTRTQPTSDSLELSRLTTATDHRTVLEPNRQGKAGQQQAPPSSQRRGPVIPHASSTVNRCPTNLEARAGLSWAALLFSVPFPGVLDSSTTGTRLAHGARSGLASNRGAACLARRPVVGLLGKIIGGVGVGGVGLLVLVELVVLASPGPAPSPCSPENHPGKPLGPWPLRESQQHSARAASRDQTAARVRSAPEREEEEQEEEERRIGRDPERGAGCKKKRWQQFSNSPNPTTTRRISSSSTLPAPSL